MRKFKLIKKHRAKGINIGDIFVSSEYGYYKCIKKEICICLLMHEVENNPEYWQEIIEEEKDPIVDSVIERFKTRSEEGIKKYGTTLESNNSLSIIDWINHAQEEGMDRLLYLEKLKSEITKLVNKIK